MINEKVLDNVLYAALSHGGDFAEVFVEDRFNTNIKMLGGFVENSMSGRDYGIGIRIFEGFNSVYGYTNDSSEDNLIKVAKELSLALKTGEKDIVLDLRRPSIDDIHEIKTIPSSVDKSKKIELLKKGYNSAKDYDSIISQVISNYFDEDQKILIANTDGLLVEDRRIRTRYSVQSVATKGDEMQAGYDAPGAAMGFEFFDKIDVEEVGREASRIAKTMVLADHCPSGVMPVVIHNAFGGVLFHEACGHSLEATSVAKGTSVFSDKLGEQIASPLVTAIDDGSLENGWGSTKIDDEGTPTQRNVLIEDGILKSYLIDNLNARRMEMESTGSGRRQSYRFAPTSRMNNTFIESGDSSFEEIIGGTENGLFAKKLGGGSVNPATGDFNFAVMEGYLIEDGKLGKPVRGATLIGTGAKVLRDIDMVGDNKTLAEGMCGSLSGSIPAGLGQPTIRIKSLTVGGRKGDE